MRRLPSYFALLLLALQACTDVEATNPYDPGAPASVKALGTLRGRVLLPDASPAVGAAVGLSDTSVTTTTDAEGRFTLSEVPEGAHLLTVALDCHRSLAVATPTFDIGDEHEQPDLQLEVATGTIEGTVSFAGGPGGRLAEVAVFQPGGGAGTRPDDTGRFALTDARACAGQTVTAVAYGYAPATASGLEVGAGETLTLDEPLVLVPLPGRVSGRLVLPAGDLGPAEGLGVSVRAFGGEVVEARTAADGAFSLAVPQGPATFVAAVPGYRTVTTPLTVPPSADDTVVADLGDVPLAWAFERVSGRVALADGGDATAVRLSLGNAERQYPALASGTGEFEFAAVRAGTYTLTATAFGYTQVGAAPEVVVADGAPVTDLNVPLAVRPGVLCGRVSFPPEPGEAPAPPVDTAGCPPLDPAGGTLPDAHVRVPTSGALEATLQADGYFRVEPRAGFHSVEIVRPGYETLQRFNVSVSDDAAIPTDLGELRLDYARAALSGIVVVADCPPHPVLVSVVATGPHGTQLVIANVPGAQPDGACVRDGVFDFPALPVGDYDLLVSSDDYIAQSARVTVPAAAGAPPLEIALAVNPATLRLTLSAEGLAPASEDTPCDAQNGAPFAALEAALLGTEGVGHPDCHGEVVLSGLRPGTYALRLSGGDDYGVLIVPTVTLSPGGAVDLGEQSLPYATGGLTGRILVPEGESPENAIITLAGRASAVAYTGADGSYSFFGVRTDPTAVLTASLPGFESQQRTVAILRDRVSPVEDIRLALFPGRVRGRVLPEGGGSAAGTRVSIAGTALEDTTDEGSAPGVEPVVLPGTFALENLRAGTYALEISRPGDARFRVGSVPNVLVPAGGDVDVGTVELSRATGAATVDVTVEDAARLDAEALALVYGAVVGRLGSRTPGESTRLEANAYLVPDCVAGARPCARIDFPAVPVDAYTLTIEREDYAPSTQEITLDVDGDAVSVDSVLLAILPGQIAGTVVDPEGTPLAGVTVTPAGGAPTTTNAAAPVGAFLAGGLREGSYAVTFTRAGYATTTLPSIGVTAGLTTDIGTIALAYATGGLHGVVELGDGASPAGVVVTAAHESGLVETTVTDAAGAWQLADVRAGNWLVTAEREAYASDDANAVVSEDAETDVGTLRLAVNPGRIVGRILLGDDDPAVSPTSAVVEILPVGTAQVHPFEDGTFALVGLKAGVYSLSVTLTDYAPAEVQGLVVGAGMDADAGDVVLTDLKAPAAPTLTLVPTFNPLSGLPETPAVQAVAVLNPEAAPGLRGGVVQIGFDAEGVDPRDTDANFDPAHGLGQWQMRTSALADWVRVPGDTPPFSIPVLIDKVTTIALRGVDAEGNAGEAAELAVMAIDDVPPASPTLREPITGCFAPSALPGTRRCVVNADAVNIPIQPAGLADKSFGCYFVQSIAAPDQTCAADGDCGGRGTCHAGFCLDAAALAWSPGSADCYPSATQYVTVFPEEDSKTFHCVRTYDRGGLASAPTCMLIEEDSVQPVAPDLFPNEIEVRADSVAIFTLLPMDEFDANISHFEKKPAGVNAQWTRARPEEAAAGSFAFDLAPGQENALSLRAVDFAGNTSEATTVYMDETSYGPVDETPAGVAYSADFAGGRATWANPRGCDALGQGRRCHFGLMTQDDGSQHEGTHQLGTAEGCFRDCLPGAGVAPLMVQSTFGLFYTQYQEATAQNPRGTHEIRALPYGADGEPGTADDADLADDCCALPGQAVDTNTAVVWLGASDRMVVWVRFSVSNNVGTWKAYALPLNVDQVSGPHSPAESVTTQTLHQNANLSGAPGDVAANFSLAGDTLLFTANAAPRAWVKLLSGAGSILGNIALPADFAGAVPFLTSTNTGLAGILTPAAAPSERRLFQVNSLDFRSAQAAGVCAANTCNAQQGCFKGVCFDLVRPAGGLPNLICTEPNGEHCGTPKALTTDGGLVAAVVTTTREGLDYDRVLLSTGPGAAPRRLLERPGPLHDTVVNFDRLMTVDETSGTPRLLRIDPTDLTWRGLDPEVLAERNHPRPLGGWTAHVAPRANGRPGLALFGNEVAGSPVTFALALPAHAQANAGDVQPWNEGRGFATFGTVLAWAEVLTAAANNAPRFRLTVIDTGVLCAAGEAGCTPYRACTADGLTCRDFKQLSAETIAVGGVPQVALPAHFPIDVAVNGSQVMLHATQALGGTALQYFMRDFVNNRTHSSLNAQSQLRGAGAAGEALTQCDAAGFASRGVANAIEDRIGCLNRLANGTWEFRLLIRASQATNWNSAAVASTLFANNAATHLGLLGNGTASEVFLIDDRTVVLESALGGGAGLTQPLLRLSTPPGNTLGGQADEYALLYQRGDIAGLGLGRTVLAPPNRLVFADTLLSMQAEIMRLDVLEGTLERLTNDEAVQVQPGVSTSGLLVYVDHRYFLTAQGGYRARPSFTVRGLP